MAGKSNPPSPGTVKSFKYGIHETHIFATRVGKHVRGHPCSVQGHHWQTVIKVDL
jgi:hypothetical protein